MTTIREEMEMWRRVGIKLMEEDVVFRNFIQNNTPRQLGEACYSSDPQIKNLLSSYIKTYKKDPGISLAWMIGVIHHVKANI